jgi:CheY-like chemotaxis protein
MRKKQRANAPLILLIENDVGNRLLAERILSLSGYHYVSTTNGQDALQLLEKQAIDLILTDLSMPEVDGFRVAQWIRARPQFAHIPIVALTAHAFEAERQRALRVGCTDLLVKPYHPKELIAMVERHLAGAAS